MRVRENDFIGKFDIELDKVLASFEKIPEIWRFSPKSEAQLFEHFDNGLMMVMGMFEKVGKELDESRRGKIFLKEVDFVVM